MILYGDTASGANPGATATDRQEMLLRHAAQEKFGDAARWRELMAPMPFGRMGLPEEIGAAVAALAGRGVRFEKFDGLQQDELGIWTAPGGSRVAWFKDPDNNLLSLSEHLR